MTQSKAPIPSLRPIRCCFIAFSFPGMRMRETERYFVMLLAKDHLLPEAWTDGLLPGPFLVAATVAGPDLHRGAVGGTRPGHIKTETRLAANNGPIGVQVPLLIGPAVAVPDLHPGSRCRSVVGDVEALVAI